MNTRDTISTDTPVQYLKGIGPRRASLLKSGGIETVEDLLRYFPRRYIDRSAITPISQIQPGDDVTIAGKILVCQAVPGRRPRFVAQVADNTGIIQCVWFQGISYISKAFNNGDTVVFSGKATVYRGLQLAHPDFDKISEEGEADTINTGRIIPLYPSTEKLSRMGLDSRGFRRVMNTALASAGGRILDVLPQAFRDEHSLIPLDEAFRQIHFPDSWDLLSRALNRFKFEELFFLQLFLAFEREKRLAAKTGIAFTKSDGLTRRFISELPFELTDAQKRVVREIYTDMQSPYAMNRLVQGDVGSGKTIVSVIAMLKAIENGFQAAMMAPTEILAEQHYMSVQKYFSGLGIKTLLLRGGFTAAQRRELYEAIANGEYSVVVGTHALVQDAVSFKKLGLAVIDEQHRFGVMQRARLMEKGTNPDVLLMTATPIPRTLALTLYGDLDVSVIDQMPAGRKPVRTVWRTAKDRPKIYTYIKEAVHKGEQAYIVYPLLEESEKTDLAAAVQEYERLSSTVFSGCTVGLMHGKMKPAEKEQVMNAFASGSVSILVSTTVIEVGVDVPDATVMVVEHAERFGLTQLHQLRGRVGRGSRQSFCILITSGRLSDEAKTRIQTMVKTTDGFKIADADLKLRGPGELYGLRQHGDLGLKVADLVYDGPILNRARSAAALLVQENPGLEGEEMTLLKARYNEIYKERFGLMAVG